MAVRDEDPVEIVDDGRGSPPATTSRRRRTSALVLAVLIGALTGIAGTTWWYDRDDPAPGADDVRLLVIAPQGLSFGGTEDSCTSVTLRLYNLGEDPIRVERLDVDVAGLRPAQQCQATTRTTRPLVQPSTALTWDLRFRFECDTGYEQPTYAATVRTADGRLRRVDGPLDVAGGSTSNTTCDRRPSVDWIPNENPRLLADGRSSRLLVEGDLTTTAAGYTVLSMATVGDAFTLRSQDIPTPLGREVPHRVRFDLAVADCGAARDLDQADLTVTVVTRPLSASSWSVTEGSRTIFPALSRLVDAACL